MHRNNVNTSPATVILELKEHLSSEWVRDGLDSGIVIEVPDRPSGAVVSVKLRRNALNAVCDKGEVCGGKSPPPLIRNRSAGKNDHEAPYLIPLWLVETFKMSIPQLKSRGHTHIIYVGVEWSVEHYRTLA
jgi:hypothetical protein